MSAIEIPVRTTAPSSRSRLQLDMRRFVAISGITLLAVTVVSIFLMPLVFMVATSFKDRTQLSAPGAPIYPARPETFTWEHLVKGPDEFRVKVTKLKSLAAPAGSASTCCCSD